MDESKAKRYAAILEIIIILSIAITLVNRALLNNHIEEVKKNFRKERQNPKTIVTAGMYGKSSRGVFNNIMGQKTKTGFARYMTFLTPIFSLFGGIFKIFKAVINKIRRALNPIRTYFYNATRIFYEQISKFTIGILYTTHKMRNAMKRSVSGFNLLFHSLEHSKNSMESTVHSKPFNMALGLIEGVEWLSDKTSSLFCFDKYTLLQLSNNTYISIEKIRPEAILKDGSEVIAIQKFANSDYIYKYGDVYVSGNHMVKENNKWIKVKNSTKATKTSIIPEYVFCISTTNGRIKIGNILFKDYEGSVNRHVNFSINCLILMHLNKGKGNSDKYATQVDYLENGFKSDTLVEMEKPTLKSISTINIGDYLINKNKVLGKIEIGNKYVSFYDDNGIIVTSNTKTNHDGTWKNIEKTNDISKTKQYSNAFNLVTANHTLSVHNKKVYRDYIEIDDPDIEGFIEDLLCD